MEVCGKVGKKLDCCTNSAIQRLQCPRILKNITSNTNLARDASSSEKGNECKKNVPDSSVTPTFEFKTELVSSTSNEPSDRFVVEFVGDDADTDDGDGDRIGHWISVWVLSIGNSSAISFSFSNSTTTEKQDFRQDKALESSSFCTCHKGGDCQEKGCDGDWRRLENDDDSHGDGFIQGQSHLQMCSCKRLRNHLLLRLSTLGRLNWNPLHRSNEQNMVMGMVMPKTKGYRNSPWSPSENRRTRHSIGDIFISGISSNSCISHEDTSIESSSAVSTNENSLLKMTVMVMGMICGGEDDEDGGKGWGWWRWLDRSGDGDGDGDGAKEVNSLLRLTEKEEPNEMCGICSKFTFVKTYHSYSVRNHRHEHIRQHPRHIDRFRE